MKIVLEDGRYYLEDIGSKCAIFVNGERVRSFGARELKPNDLVSFDDLGRYQLIFTYDGDLEAVWSQTPGE